MSFRDKPFAVRYEVMGDPAENVFEAVKPLGKVQRFGWRRPNFSMRRMSNVLKHSPDYYCEAGYLAEVMGCGRDGILKLKESKYKALQKWNAFAEEEVILFAWNSHTNEYVILSYENLKKLASQAKRKGLKSFEEGTTYYPIDWENAKSTADVVGLWSED